MQRAMFCSAQQWDRVQERVQERVQQRVPLSSEWKIHCQSAVRKLAVQEV